MEWKLAATGDAGSARKPAARPPEPGATARTADGSLPQGGDPAGGVRAEEARLGEATGSVGRAGEADGEAGGANRRVGWSSGFHRRLHGARRARAGRSHIRAEAAIGGITH